MPCRAPTLGASIICHDLPSQCSMSDAWSAQPAAHTLDADTTDTDRSPLALAPVGGPGTIDQAEPFQCSSTGSGWTLLSPTAHRSLAETAAIASSSPSCVYFVTGVARVFHADPSKCSAKPNAGSKSLV